MDIFVIIILIVIGLAALLAFYVFIKSSKKGLNNQQVAYIKNNWQKVINEAIINPNNSIMEADKLLWYALKSRGIEGSVGDQLKIAGSMFSDLNSVWSAHKLRNQIAHEIGMKITTAQAKSNLNIFKNALKDLGAKF